MSLNDAGGLKRGEGGAASGKQYSGKPILGSETPYRAKAGGAERAERLANGIGSDDIARNHIGQSGRKAWASADATLGS